ncbi:peptidoglycan-binding protein [Clostridium sp. D2Q-11]|uniref:Peptidoglycan-binding protein n=1 Tax=Anaeromonas frigoriresistens TaxID=2683708 RepID=A0A942UWD6_9FIRM|nr:M14 family metallopeptidase [Anaeromonas frigoriresistens]MBS4538765.1 peptidoglycan-binding protein [Anaeromonas frigoriresistens]
METLRLGSTGNDVKLLQSVLSKVGYDPGPIDGVFGDATRQAVIEFQRDNGLTVDGIVGPNTWNLLERFIEGYDTYTIRPGDTFYNIARRYYTTVNAIRVANPGIDPNNLIVGTQITVPYGIDVVLTDVGYTYDIMEMNIRGLQARYPFLEVGSAGESVLGRELYYLRLGRGPRKVFYNASHHSLEWINSPVMMKFAEKFLQAYVTGSFIRGYNVPEIWESSSIYIVPMVNPDGVDVVINGITPENPYYEDILEWNDTGEPLSQVWNANIRGVDLNRNYPAEWQQAKDQEEDLGVTGPGPTRYGGPAPLSEPESQAMVDFTVENDFDIVLAYHTQGRVIYWQYLDITPPRARAIGEIYSDITGYTLSDVPYAAAYAGYKDWFIDVYRRPGYTFETGLGRNPLPISQFNRIYDENEEVLLITPII